MVQTLGVSLWGWVTLGRVGKIRSEVRKVHASYGEGVTLGWGWVALHGRKKYEQTRAQNGSRVGEIEKWPGNGSRSLGFGR